MESLQGDIRIGRIEGDGTLVGRGHRIGERSRYISIGIVRICAETFLHHSVFKVDRDYIFSDRIAKWKDQSDLTGNDRMPAFGAGVHY